MRILVIDTDVDVLAALGACSNTQPRGQGYEFIHAGDDDQALALLESEQTFDLALVSIDDRQLAGLGVFKKLIARSRRIPRVALTQGGEISAIKRALAAGAADILIKPINPQDFRATIRRVMQQVEQRRRNWRERGAYMALRREVDIAADMQRRILPQRFPSDESLDFAAIMQPARGVGGDFYDVFRIDAQQIGFLIADVSGKGIPAAFYMAVASTTLRSVAMHGMAPGDCLTEVNNYLVERDIPGMFVSVFYAVLNTQSWQIRCSNAGHDAPLLCCPHTDRATAFASAGGPVLGILADQRYGESCFELEAGACVLLHTDGVSEAFNPAREQFGAERLANVVAARDADSAEHLLSCLNLRLHEFSAAAEQHDDITAMAVRRCA